VPAARNERRVYRNHHPHKHGSTEGCTIPARWCEAHHSHPWAQGGHTNLQDAALLCSFHHHLAHDPKYKTTGTPTGDWQFHLRA
jgi:hypothetical protein